MDAIRAPVARRSRNQRFTRGVANPANFDYWERRATSFSHIAALRTRSATLTGAGDAARISSVGVMPGFFDAIGVSPAMAAVLAQPLRAAGEHARRDGRRRIDGAPIFPMGTADRLSGRRA